MLSSVLHCIFTELIGVFLPQTGSKRHLNKCKNKIKQQINNSLPGIWLIPYFFTFFSQTLQTEQPCHKADVTCKPTAKNLGPHFQNFLGRSLEDFFS